MAGKYPHPAGTGQRENFTKQTRRIVRHRAPCENCGTPTPARNTHCRTCITLHAIHARTVEISALLQAVKS